MQYLKIQICFLSLISVCLSQVGANDIISFQAGWTSSTPQLFPTTNTVTKFAYVVAPFWSDNDLRLAGNATYQVYGPSSQLINASTFITDTTGTNFSGTWMLVAQWNGAHPYPHGNSPTSPAVQAVSIIIPACNLHYLSLFFRPTLTKPLL